MLNNQMIKWMMTGGTPQLNGNFHIDLSCLAPNDLLCLTVGLGWGIYHNITRVLWYKPTYDWGPTFYETACVLMFAPTDGLSLLFLGKPHSIHWLIIIVPYVLREYGHTSGVLQRSYIGGPNVCYTIQIYHIFHIHMIWVYHGKKYILGMGQNWVPLTNFMVDTKHISKDVCGQKGDLFATSSSGNRLHYLDGFVEAFL